MLKSSRDHRREDLAEANCRIMGVLSLTCSNGFASNTIPDTNYVGSTSSLSPRDAIERIWCTEYSRQQYSGSNASSCRMQYQQLPPASDGRPR